MNIKKHWTRIVNGKKYYKYTVIIPNEVIKKMGWTPQTSLCIKTKGGDAVLIKPEKQELTREVANKITIERSNHLTITSTGKRVPLKDVTVK